MAYLLANNAAVDDEVTLVVVWGTDLSFYPSIAPFHLNDTQILHDDKCVCLDQGFIYPSSSSVCASDYKAPPIVSYPGINNTTSNPP